MNGAVETIKLRLVDIQNHKIILTFDVLKLEKSSNCENDYIEIIDTIQNKNYGRICRIRHLKEFFITGSHVKIRFKSNEQINKPGFSLSYKQGKFIF